MARLNSNYGSEVHLLRILGRHRDYFNRRICEATHADQAEWIDFPSGERRRDKNGNVLWDREWHHLQFLPAGDPARIAWENAWPTHRTGPNWDAIARLRFGSTNEWLLLEAKANVEEMRSECGAEDAQSINRITQTLDAAKEVFGASPSRDWLRPYYQFCNRLGALYVANGAGTPTRLLYVYFCGDEGDKSRTCPSTEDAWLDELRRQNEHLGLVDRHQPYDPELHDRVHKVFIDVECPG